MEALEGGVDLLCLGEMGIGNTTAARRSSARCHGGGPGEWAGPGTGVDAAGVAAQGRGGGQGTRSSTGASCDDPLRGAALLWAAGACRHRRRELGGPIARIPVSWTVTPSPPRPRSRRGAGPGALDHAQTGHARPKPAHRSAARQARHGPPFSISGCGSARAPAPPSLCDGGGRPRPPQRHGHLRPGRGQQQKRRLISQAAVSAISRRWLSLAIAMTGCASAPPRSIPAGAGGSPGRWCRRHPSSGSPAPLHEAPTRPFTDPAAQVRRRLSPGAASAPRAKAATAPSSSCAGIPGPVSLTSRAPAARRHPPPPQPARSCLPGGEFDRIDTRLRRI